MVAGVDRREGEGEAYRDGQASSKGCPVHDWWMSRGVGGREWTGIGHFFETLSFDSVCIGTGNSKIYAFP